MSSITFTDVSKTFDETVAVEHLNLEVADGEFLVLLGPSGCGKSTVLRILAGLETPTAGTVTIGDQDVTTVDARHRDVAMVFQSYALYPHMTVAQNIESPLIGRRSERTTRDLRRQQVERAAAMLGLDDLLGRKPAQLSGGQRQRVALARALVRRPAVFLMDEPLSNLDAKLRTETRAELVALHAELGATFVYVTHDQVEAMTMATRIAVLNDGRLQQVASPRMLYDQPANTFVARFIGSPPMNIVPARLCPTAQRSSVEIAGQRLRINDVWSASDIGDGGPVDVGIRPEDIHLVDDGIAGTVIAHEWLGHEQILDVEVAGTRVLLRHPESTASFGPGARVHFTAKPGDIHLFDADSGERIHQAGTA